MSGVDKVLKVLKSRTIVPTVDDYSIRWMEGGDEHHIQLKNIACEEERIAWLQSSEKDEHLLRVFCETGSFNWRPTTYNPYFGCDGYLLEWIGQKLVFIYKEKHDTYICVIENKEVNTFNFHGNELSRMQDIILFTVYGEEEVRRIQLPGLAALAPFSRSEAVALGVLPQMIIGNELQKK